MKLYEKLRHFELPAIEIIFPTDLFDHVRSSMLCWGCFRDITIIEKDFFFPPEGVMRFERLSFFAFLLILEACYDWPSFFYYIDRFFNRGKIMSVKISSQARSGFMKPFIDK